MALLEGVSFPFLLEDGESQLVSCTSLLKKTPGHFWLTDRRVVWAQDPKSMAADVAIGIDRIHCTLFLLTHTAWSRRLSELPAQMVNKPKPGSTRFVVKVKFVADASSAANEEELAEIDLVFPSQPLQIAVKNALAGLLSSRRQQQQQQATAAATPLGGPSRPTSSSSAMSVDTEQAVMPAGSGIDEEEIRARLAILKEDATARKLHKDLVQTSRTMTEEEFWETRRHLLQSKKQPPQIKGIPHHLLSFCKPRQLANGTVGYQVPDELKQLLLSRKKKLKALYRQQVPAHMTEELFWNKYMASAQNHYNKNGVLSQKARKEKLAAQLSAQQGKDQSKVHFKTHAMETGGPVDVFDALEENEDRPAEASASPVEQGRAPRDIDLAANASDHYYTYGNLPDRMMLSGSTDESQQAVHFLSHLNRDNAYFVRSAHNRPAFQHVLCFAFSSDRATAKEYQEDIAFQELKRPEAEPVLPLHLHQERNTYRTSVMNGADNDSASSQSSNLEDIVTDVLHWNPRLQRPMQHDYNRAFAEFNQMIHTANDHRMLRLQDDAETRDVRVKHASAVELLTHFWMVSAQNSEGAKEARKREERRASMLRAIQSLRMELSRWLKDISDVSQALMSPVMKSLDLVLQQR